MPIHAGNSVALRGALLERERPLSRIDQRVKRTVKGAVDMVIAVPARSKAALNCLRKAQVRADWPKPKPGSFRTVTDLARPLGPTVTVSWTTALSMPSMSASAGNSHSFQLPARGAAGRERSGPGGGCGATGPGGGALPTPSAAARVSCTAFLDLPSLALMP